VTTARDEIANGVVGSTPVDAGPRNVSVVERVHPFLAPIPERRVQPPERDTRSARNAVVGAAGEAPAGAVILVVAKIDAVVVRSQAREGGRRFDFVDPGAVPVVGAADEHAQLPGSAESFADGGARLAHAAPSDDGRKAAEP